jgi:hypothetical protein
MDEIISYNMCAVKVRNAKLRNYLKLTFVEVHDKKESKLFSLASCTN